MSKSIDIWVVTEYQLDYDDYPIGSGKVILVTADEARARNESSWQHHEWTIPAHYGHARSNSRSAEKFTVEDVPE